MMTHPISTRRNLIIACFGLAIGLCVGTVFKNYRALEHVRKCTWKPTNTKHPLEIIGMPPNNSIYNSQKNLVFVGVMTAKNFLNDRAKAVYNTWGKQVPGYIAFFSSEGSISDSLPVVSLKNVDDRYPPQKKSFMMLYYMYEHFIDKFEWFIRADDDVYINVEKLEPFLRSIDSGKPQFIGQAGKGNSEEFGLLSLEFDENFCMGGPGVIMSRETLRRVAPHIPTCLQNLYSTHEDVEVGRCVQKFAGIPCTWNYEMQYILRHNSSGKKAFTGSLKRKEVHNAISLHPVKQGPLMYRLHSYMQGLKADELRQESLLLHRDILRMAKLLHIPEKDNFLVPGITLFPTTNEGEHHFTDHTVLGVSPELNKYTPSTTSDLLEWTFIGRSLYSVDHANPKRKIDSATREGLEDTITEVMENINNFSRQRGRVIDFQELLYGYTRVNNLHGQDWILDLHLIYKKYRGKKMTVPVRRHIYVQRSFTGVFVKELNEELTLLDNKRNYKELLSSMKQIISTGLEKISNSLPKFQSSSSNEKQKIVFVLPISGRLDTYSRFLQNFEQVALNGDKSCELLVMIFGNHSSIQNHVKLANDFKHRYSKEKINYITLEEPFSRGIALDTATRSDYIRSNDIIFFIDVDLIFKQETLDRVRMNTVLGKQVYLPIVFGGYDPANYNWPKPPEEIDIRDDLGYFRQFGYGICAIFKADILDPDIDGFDTNIKGWGLEDVRLLEKIIKVGQRQNSFLVNTSEVAGNYNNTVNVRKLAVFRSPDPSLIHVYHSVSCDVKLEKTQYNMCLGSKANTLGSTAVIEHLFLNNKDNINFIAHFLGNPSK